MSLRFPCEHCGKEITVRYLKPGDKALCRHCGRSGSVPENAVPTDDVPDYEVRTGYTPRPPAGGEYGAGISGGGAGPRSLGPRNLGDFLGETFSVYGDKILRFIAVLIAPVIILFALAYIPRYYMERAAYSVDEFSLLYILPLIPYFFMYMIVAIVISGFIEGALVYIVAGRYVEGAGGVGRAFTFAWGKILRLIGARLLQGVIFLAVGSVGAGFYVALRFAAGLPGLAGFVVFIFVCIMIYLGVIWIFLGHTVLLENCGPLSALARSMAHVHKHWWRVFGITLVISLIFAFIAIVLSLIFMLILREVGQVIVQILVMPISFIITTLLYFDIRVRKEGYKPSDLAAALEIGKETGPGQTA